MSTPGPSQRSDMPTNMVDQSSSAPGTVGGSTSQAPSTSKRSAGKRFRTTMKGIFSGSKTLSSRATTPTPQPIEASHAIEQQGVVNDAPDVIKPGNLTSKRAEKVPEDTAEADHKKIVRLELGISAINALRDVSQVTGTATNQPNPVGPVLEKVTGVLSTLKQMMENRSAWETLLRTLDSHQLAFNQQLARLKKDHLDADSTSPFLGPIKEYSTALEEILAAIIKESGLTVQNGPGGDRWETIKNFSSRYINADSEKDQIQACDRRISDAMNDLKLALIMHISDKVQGIDDKLDSMEDKKVLARLKIKGLECGSLVPGCMEGTRQDILEKIRDWTADPDAPNILWLKGHPGVGKSAIATKVVDELRTTGRLGSSFFFHRQNATIMTTSLLWCTVAYDLALKYPAIRKRIITAVNMHELGPTSVNVEKLFLYLIHEPLTGTEAVPEDSSPVVVVDALDECGGLDIRRQEHRRSLMQTLRNWSRLPSKFKLIVTSRRGSDIDRVFSTTNHRLVEILAGKTVEPQSSKDIQVFVKVRFQAQVMDEYEELLPPDYGTRVAEDLAERAAGLFIWAETVVKFISQGEPQSRLEQVSKGGGAGDMNFLYSEILKDSFGQATEEEIKNFCAIVGTIVLAKVPLSVSSLRQLLSLSEIQVRHICKGLRSVLDSSGTLKFYHQSFVDFLMDPVRSPHQFRFQRNRESRNLTLACLRVMKSELRFNICDLKSSYLRNSDVADLDSRVEKCIPPYVSYSCRFWVMHLEETKFDVEVFEPLQYFMEYQFLFWLETLSLTKQVHVASSMLLVLIDWNNDNQQDNALARDTRKFVATFGRAISQSTPHIYLSALAFSPQNSAVAKQYGQRFPRLIRMKAGGLTNWPTVQNVLSGHGARVTSVAFSPNGTRIVSGSCDKTIRVWDASTGEVVVGPLEGHSEHVNSVTFSRDGSRIASGSSDWTIRVWDAETGQILAGPLEGQSSWGLPVVFSPHTGPRSEGRDFAVWDAAKDRYIDFTVTSVAFSPDGSQIASGSADWTIRVWDVETGEVSGGPLEGHSGGVTSVAYSPDGTRIVSGSYDETIRVWDAKTGQIVVGPFEAHSGTVSSVAFSPDGSRIVSAGSRMIRVWDAETGELATGPIEGQPGTIESVAFSPDGTRIVFGSHDNRIRVWDAKTGEMVAGPFEGHSSWVTSVAFSPDGTQIVSGSADHTVRMWDAETDLVEAGHFNWHTGPVHSAVFSPDATRIASGSLDRTVRVWDAETGEVVAGPFEGHEGSVSCVAFSPDGTRIASSSEDMTIRVWDAKTGDLLAGPFEGDGTWVNSVLFSPDGTRIVSTFENKRIQMWDAETGAVIASPFQSHGGMIIPFAFSSDGTRIVSAGSKTIRVWDVETGEILAERFKALNSPINSVTFSPDRTQIVSGSDDNMVRVWNAETVEVVAGPFEGHRDAVWCVAFSPDGRHVVSGSGDHTVRVWNAETGELVAGPFEWHKGAVPSVAFSPDGTRILSSSSDGTIRLWDFKIGDPNYLDHSLPSFDSSGMHDGWILGSNSELGLWIPPTLREGLHWPYNRVSIGNFVKTRLDSALFVHGESWSQCKG